MAFLDRINNRTRNKKALLYEGLFSVIDSLLFYGFATSFTVENIVQTIMTAHTANIHSAIVRSRFGRALGPFLM